MVLVSYFLMMGFEKKAALRMKEEYRPNIHMVDNALVRDYNKNVETQTVATTLELT